MNSNLVMMPLTTPSSRTTRRLILSMVKRKWILDIGVSMVTIKGEWLISRLGSEKSIGVFQKLSIKSL